MRCRPECFRHALQEWIPRLPDPVAISDSGPGLPSANLARIFEAFYTTKASGLGMGLSICRSIVEAHGGRLWATQNEPRGAVFCMALPVGDKLPE
jgi:signal transduction histidine kinase